MNASSKSSSFLHNEILGITWFHGSLSVRTFKKGNLQGSWDAPELVTTLEGFETALDTALQAVSFKGKTVTLILESEDFVHQTETIPPASTSIQRNYLQRCVERYEKAQNQKMLWTYETMQASKTDVSAILHLLPSSFFEKIQSILTKRELDLVQLLPVIPTLGRFLETTENDPSESTLVVAEIGETTTIIAGQKGGHFFFGRTIQASWSNDSSRAVTEINRSIHYTRQHYHFPVQHVVLIGHSAHKIIEEVRSTTGIDLTVTEKEETSESLLTEAIHLSDKHPSNLISGHAKEKKRKRLIKTTSLSLSWLIFFFSLTTFITNEFRWNSHQTMMTSLETDIAALEEEKLLLEKRNETAQQHQLFIKNVLEDRLHPVAPLFLNYVAKKIPDDLLMTDFSVLWDQDISRWNFEISGTGKTGKSYSPNSLKLFKETLSQSPFSVHFNDDKSLNQLAGIQVIMPSNGQFTLKGDLFAK